jgi:predicted transcriptional regulator of viral defense system
MSDKRASGRGDAAIAEIAARQHGVVTAQQVYAAGLTREGVRRRVGAGRLHPVFRGVYAVGHAGLGDEGKWMAAVLACGESAALSHRSAAELWGLLKPADGPVHVTVPGVGGRSKRAGINLHRSRCLTNSDTTRRYGIAVTTPARTIRDLRRTASPKLVRRAIRQAEFDRLPIGKHAGERDNELAARGLEVLRFTDVRIDNEPAAVARLVRARIHGRSLSRLSRYA